MIDLRLRTKIKPEELEQKIGKIVTDRDANVLLTGPCKVRKPDGKPLCIYLPNALDKKLMNETYPTLHGLKSFQTNNRGLASGTERKRLYAGERTYSKPIASAIIGAFEAKRPYMYCRLTAWTGQEWDKYTALFPLFRQIGERFEQYVPDRYQAQMERAKQTPQERVIRGTPFTTITVNNTYPTGVHTDKGDLDEGFSCLAVMRYGDYSGGRLTFPEFRVAVDMNHGDLLLMDAHEWHGNTAIQAESTDAERISIVAYFRTRMTNCGPMEDEARRGQDQAQVDAARHLAKVTASS